MARDSGGGRRVAHLRVVHGRAEAEVYELGPEGLEIGRGCDGLRIDDQRASRRHVRVFHAAAGWCLEDLGSRNGGFLDGRAFAPGTTQAPLADGALIRLANSLFVLRLSPAPNAEPEPPALVAAFPGVSPQAREVRRRLAALAGGAGHVLVLGEAGVGKERVARAIAGDRAVVAVDCGALAGERGRGELLVHASGAAWPALVATAKDCVLLLDEIGDLSLARQAELLRFLDDGTHRVVGDAHALRGEARVVATTRGYLERAAERGDFRRDVLARLRASHAPLAIPALRDRREDLVGWSARFARDAGLEADALWTAGALECVMLFPWSKNLRALRQVVHDLVAAGGPPPWSSEMLPDELRAHRSVVRARGAIEAAPARDSLPVPTRQAIEAAMIEAHGNMAAVARRLGVEPSRLYRLCSAFELRYEDDFVTPP
ncbi:MAG TPA: sigma 54-interacting transcriptional regulator [Kofleriaceae bacterium]|nr:sigma 54-interacting transcriptional regulator [Kofleriaceae bacterium]